MTGKGGVGKTTMSMTLTRHLCEQGHDARYLTFGSNSLSQVSLTDGDKELAEKLGIANVQLKLIDCAQGYVAKKLKSETLAKWVVKTPFFKALLNMTPGFSYLIYLGKVIDSLRENPGLTYVLDSPSSGHVLTMLESIQNAKDIFKSGLLFDDAGKILKLIESENFAQINIFTLPTMLAATESLDLKQEISQITSIKTLIFCNNCLGRIPNIDTISLPNFLEKKIEIENSIMEQYQDAIRRFLPHILSSSESEVVEKLSPLMEELLND